MTHLRSPRSRSRKLGSSSAGTWLHGEAVSAGIVMAADLSFRCGWIERDLLDRTVALLQRANLPVTPPQVSTLQLGACICIVCCSFARMRACWR